MRYAVLGTGVVGRTLATKLVELGNEVTMGARAAGGEAALAWVASAGAGAREGSFADAAQFGAVVVNATAGVHALDALRMAGAENLRGKVLVDVTNALAGGGLAVANDDSVGEQVQRTFPEARVVKTLNTMNCEVMVQPSLVPGRHMVFVSGDDADAKRTVGLMLQSFGWPEDSVVDLGGIETARAVEMYVPLWIRMRMALGTNHFNIGLQVEGR